jgi:DNA-binding phage protein
MVDMARATGRAGLSRPFRKTVARRVRSDAAFRAALVDEAARNSRDGDIEIAFCQLRDIVNATMGFAALATMTGVPKTSLTRMLGPHGDPRAANLRRIFEAINTAMGMRVAVGTRSPANSEAAGRTKEPRAISQ